MSELLTPCPNEAANFYGISVSETDGSPALTGINKLNFDSNDFSVTGNGDEATIAFTGSAADGGFYGVSVSETDGSPSFSGINKLNFDSQWFYVQQNSPNTDEVIVNFKGVPAGTGEANTASNVGGGEGIFAQKSGVDLQFKSLVTGSEIALSSDSTTITIASIARSFYGIIVKESDDSVAIKHDTIVFDSDDFNVSNSGGKPLVEVSPLIARLSDVPPGFYGIVIEESDGSNSQKDDTIRFLATDFDISNTNNKPQVALSSDVARLSDIDPGFYGIIVKESDNSIALKDDTISFVSADFDVTEVSDKPQVAISANIARITDIPPGFYGIIVEESDGTNTHRDDTIRFLVSDFDITTVNSKPQIALATDVARLSDIDPGFYGIVIEESDGSNSQRDDTIRFLVTDFDISSVNSKPQVALATTVARLSDIPPGFYGIIVKESDNSIALRDDTISFVSADFDVTETSNKPQVAISTNIARLTDIGPSFYGIVVEESDGSNSQKDDTIRFLESDFDVSSVNSKPQVALATNVARLSDLPPGFYGIVVAETDGTPSFSGIKKIDFESQWFYVEQNSPNTDGVVVNFRGVPAGTGEANTASNLGAGEGVFAQKVGVDLQFKSLVEGTGISLTSDANEITIAATGSASGFYGITARETDGSPAFRGLNVVSFNITSFYLSQDPANTDEVTVNFKGPVRRTIMGGTSDVGGNATSVASYGHNNAVSDPVMAYAGRVTAISLSLTLPRTQGSIIAFVSKNGVDQDAADQVVQINTAEEPQFKYAVITPISYLPGDRIGLRTTTVNFKSDKSDPTIVAFLEENV